MNLTRTASTPAAASCGSSARSRRSATSMAQKVPVRPMPAEQCTTAGPGAWAPLSSCGEFQEVGFSRHTRAFHGIAAASIPPPAVIITSSCGEKDNRLIQARRRARGFQGASWSEGARVRGVVVQARSEDGCEKVQVAGRGSMHRQCCQKLPTARHLAKGPAYILQVLLHRQPPASQPC